jgi:hypothetical protein
MQLTYRRHHFTAESRNRPSKHKKAGVQQYAAIAAVPRFDQLFQEVTEFRFWRILGNLNTALSTAPAAPQRVSGEVVPARRNFDGRRGCASNFDSTFPYVQRRLAKCFSNNGKSGTARRTECHREIRTIPNRTSRARDSSLSHLDVFRYYIFCMQLRCFPERGDPPCSDSYRRDARPPVS